MTHPVDARAPMKSESTAGTNRPSDGDLDIVSPTESQSADRGRRSGGVALVSGAAGDLGRACAYELASRGIAVALVDLDSDRLRTVADALAASGASHVAVTADVTSPASVAEAYGAVSEQLGDVSILVNAAGVATGTRFQDITIDEWETVMGVSVTGTFLLTQACLPSMKRHGYGRIVNFSSTAGKNVSTLAGAHYTSAKAAVLGLTRAVAQELAPDGITVNAICPGLFNTEMARRVSGQDDLKPYVSGIPAGRLGEPWEIGALVAFLVSDESTFITGAAIDINGGELMV